MKLCHFEAGLLHPLFLIAGPCVIESEQLALDTAGYLRDLTHELQIPFIYKSSFDKANRSSHKSFRGIGIDAGLKILQKVKQERADLTVDRKNSLGKPEGKTMGTEELQQKVFDALFKHLAR